MDDKISHSDYLEENMFHKSTGGIIRLIINAVFCALLYNAKEYQVLALVVISTTLLLIQPIAFYIGARIANADDVVDAWMKLLKLTCCVDIVDNMLFFLSIAFSTYVLLPNVICVI